MGARPDRWVTCPEYAAGPFTEAGAAAALKSITDLGACPWPHEVTITSLPPATAGRHWEGEGPLGP